MILLVIFFLGLLATILGFVPFEAYIPLAGTNSWLISAACPRPEHEQDAALGEVKWGVIPGSRSADIAGHCAFSSGPVQEPKVGKIDK